MRQGSSSRHFVYFNIKQQASNFRIKALAFYKLGVLLRTFYLVLGCKILVDTMWCYWTRLDSNPQRHRSCQWYHQLVKQKWLQVYTRSRHDSLQRAPIVLPVHSTSLPGR